MDKEKKYYTLEVNAIVQSLQTDPTSGLAESEVRKRLEEHGRNVVDEKKQVGALTILLRQFSNPIVWILIIAALVAFSFNHSLEGIAVTIVLAINALIGFFMERQALRSMEKLRTMAATKAKVVRDGKIQEIDSASIVPGDILQVNEGDVVTADARLIEHNRLAVKEAALTGESTQVDKTTERLNDDVGIADQKNMIFKGTIVSRGRAKAVVTLPLLPLQILFINMITDTFPALAIGMGEGDEDVVMKRKPRKSSVPIIANTDWASIAIYSLCMTAGVIGVEFYALYVQRHDQTIVNNITFYTLIMAQLWHVFNMSSREMSFFRNQITENKYSSPALLLCVGMTVAAYLIPPSRSALSLVPMEWDHLAVILIASILPVVLIQLLKRVFKVSQ